MATVIAYGSNRFIVGQMTKKEKAILKKDKPELYAKYCGVIKKATPVK